MRPIALLCLLLLASPVLRAQNGGVASAPVAGSVHMITGPRAGNVGVLVGADGVFMVDSQFAPLAAHINKRIRALSDKPLRYLVNTHWHPDHTNGNEPFGKRGVTIVAHENVRKRMSMKQEIPAFGMKVDPSPAAALPTILVRKRLSFHFNGETIALHHVPFAHSDGDLIVHFEGSKVVHMGDLFFNGMYPFIDVASGGSVRGMIQAADRALKLCGEGTKIIPGHGPQATAKDLKAFRDMLARLRSNIKALLAQGKSVDEVVAAKPTAEFDATWGKGFLKGGVFARICAESIKREK